MVHLQVQVSEELGAGSPASLALGVLIRAAVVCLQVNDVLLARRVRARLHQLLHVIVWLLSWYRLDAA